MSQTLDDSQLFNSLFRVTDPASQTAGPAQAGFLSCRGEGIQITLGPERDVEPGVGRLLRFLDLCRARA